MSLLNLSAISGAIFNIFTSFMHKNIGMIHEKALFDCLVYNRYMLKMFLVVAKQFTGNKVPIRLGSLIRRMEINFVL